MPTEPSADSLKRAVSILCSVEHGVGPCLNCIARAIDEAVAEERHRWELYCDSLVPRVISEHERYPQ